MAFRTLWENILRAPAGEGDGGDGNTDGGVDTGDEAGKADAAAGGDAGKASSDGAGEAGKAGAGAPAWPAEGFPEDWADRMLKSSGLNEEVLKSDKTKAFFERRKSPADVLKSALSADSRIEELTKEVKDRIKPLTGKDDKPEDIEAWNKILGVPKEASEYKVWEDPKAPWSPEEKAMIAGVLPLFHEDKVGQQGVDAALRIYAKIQKDSERQFQVAAQKAADTTKENLRIEYQGGYDAQVELANRVAVEVFGKYIPKGSSVHNLLSMPLATGGTIGDNEPFVRAMIDLGKVFGDHGALETGMSDPKGLEDRRKDLHAMQIKDPKGYASPAVQEELVRITTALMRQGKAGAR